MIAEALKFIDSLGSIEAELEHLVAVLPTAEPARAEESERRAKILEEQAKNTLSSLDDTPQQRDQLDQRSVATMRGEGRAMARHIKELREKHSELVEGVRARAGAEPRSAPTLDLHGAFRPIADFYAALLGSGAVGDGGKTVFRVSGHAIEFHGAGISVSCEDAEGVRRLLHAIAEKAPSFVADVANESKVDRSKLSQETQDILNHAEENTFSRVKLVRKEMKEKQKADKEPKAEKTGDKKLDIEGE